MTHASPRHRPKHRLGQNFLHDERVRAQIVAAAELTPEDEVLEIGPGRGFLTAALLQAAPARLVAVELDRSLGPFLEPLAAEDPRLNVIWGDFLKTPWEQLGLQASGRTKVVANIPYYITTPILMHLLQADRVAREPLEAITPRAERIILMVQWEVAQRLMAPPGGKDYGSLSLVAQYAAEVTLVTRVPAGAFRPRPEVDSAVVMLRPRTTAPVQVQAPAMLSRVIRGAFQQRRKTLQNSLLGAGIPRESLLAAAAALRLDLGRRAETLSLAEFAALADRLAEGPPC